VPNGWNAVTPSGGSGQSASLDSPIIRQPNYSGTGDVTRRSPDPPLCFNQPMFARKIRVEYDEDGNSTPCPLKWLDSFSMRNFTNASVFDDTLPLSDGQMEVGSNVPLDQLREAMEDWFHRKGYLPKDSKLSLLEN
jgi:hypothetical protein